MDAETEEDRSVRWIKRFLLVVFILMMFLLGFASYVAWLLSEHENIPVPSKQSSSAPRFAEAPFIPSKRPAKCV